VLRVRLIAGDRLDVTYEEADSRDAKRCEMSVIVHSFCTKRSVDPAS
jgi:hypothetical protein